MRLQPPARPRGSLSREIGPFGTAGRVAGGALLIAVAIARDDSIRAWDVAFAVSALPLIAGLTAALVPVAYQQRAPRALARDGSAWSGPSLAVVALVLGIATALTFVTPANEPAIWLFVGISMLVAAARGQGGCELVALSNVFSGRDDRVGCAVYGPVDEAEARHRARRMTHARDEA